MASPNPRRDDIVQEVDKFLHTSPKQNNEGRPISDSYKAVTNPVSASKEKPYAVQVSRSRRRPTCPYHTPIVDLCSPRDSTNDMTPMEKFLSSSQVENPVTLFECLRVGTAASGGCTCGNTLQRQCTAML
ncbi:hypothetical protein BU23DRAFT_267976 [Bimuria novae-zelandiae CBS 107.79]|uniref:Uncharacterized protein n=1 Tax=Bimuria novae-zelandiae CBS 107.79 TaxID=1447943 RepID=A0A6A5USJ5_9PLEO|nr:hypothetical protein BU23DRAFT_267976 [Bimuria novae-zelandiae CBS 107.79]